MMTNTDAITAIRNALALAATADSDDAFDDAHAMLDFETPMTTIAAARDAASTTIDRLYNALLAF